MSSFETDDREWDFVHDTTHVNPSTAMQWVTYLKIQLSTERNIKTARALFQLIFKSSLHGSDIKEHLALNSSTYFLQSVKLKFGFMKNRVARSDERLEMLKSLALIAHQGFTLEELMCQND